MTIGVYYHTFGFLVKKADYLKHFGYVLENLPETYKSDACDGDDLDDELNEWIQDEHANGFAFYKNIKVDTYTYTLRGFTHDDKFAEYLVVGIDLGSIDRWDGTRRDGSSHNPQESIRALAKSPEWISLIQACSDVNCTHYDRIEYGVQHPKYEKFSISPAVYITADDCNCCSCYFPYIISLLMKTY